MPTIHEGSFEAEYFAEQTAMGQGRQSETIDTTSKVDEWQKEMAYPVKRILYWVSNVRTVLENVDASFFSR